MKTQILTIIFVMTIHSAVAQISFEPLLPAPPAPQITHDFLKVAGSSAEFADVNGDGKPDVLITGDIDPTGSTDAAVALYLNNGSGSYIQVQDVPFDKVISGSVDFADIDGDNDLDVLITGYYNATNIRTKLYTNDGNGNFSLFANELVLKAVGSGDADFADIDGDDDQDLLIIGSNNQEGSARLYENDGSGNFTLINDTTFTPVWNGTVDFEDVDGDNDPDLLITGAFKINSNNKVTITELYLNDGSGNFSPDTRSSFSKVHKSTVNFADFDGDNDPDVFITGDSTYSGNDGQVAAMYFNNGNGIFTLATGNSFTNIEQGDGDVSDIDNDGDQDILLTGYKGYNKGGNTAELYTNNGAGHFTLTDDVTFPKINSGAVSFADVDADGDPDVMVVGNKGSSLGGNVANLYTNNGTGKFTMVPRSQFIEVGEKSHPYSAADFADVDIDGDLDLMISGKSDSSDVNTVLYFNDGDGNFSMADNTTFAALNNAALSFADVDKDGYPDVLMAGYGKFPQESYKRLAALYKYNPNSGKYELADNTTFTGVTDGVVKFADVDRDGDEDVLIMGSNNSNSYSTKLYANDGSGNFTASDVSFTGMTSGDAAFADVNGDGYVDLFLTGYNAGRLAELYLNDGTGSFSISDDQSFEKVYNSSVAFADVDGDNDQDLFVSGDGDGSYNSVGNLYLNDGQGNFTLQSASSIKGVSYSAMAFTDMDTDGDVDLIITGLHFPDVNTSGIQICEAYTNDGSGNFSLVSDLPFSGFTGVGRGKMAIADINNDNYQDVLFVGWSHSGRTSKLFINKTCPDCVPDPCAGIICPEGQLCYEGYCFDTCATTGNTPCTDLGPNLIAQSGTYVGIDAGDGYDIYEWSTGDSTQSIIVNASGQYWVIAFDTDAEVYSTDTVNILIKSHLDGTCPDGLENWNGFCFQPSDACDGISCPEGQWCYEGTCYDGSICDGENDTNPNCFVEATCENVVCPDGQMCKDGECVEFEQKGFVISPGSSIKLSAIDYYLFYEWSTGEITKDITVNTSGQYTYKAISYQSTSPYILEYQDTINILVKSDPVTGCPDGQVEKDGYCFADTDPCLDTSCPEGYECWEGECYPVCDETISCGENSICYAGKCFQYPDCEDVMCPVGMACKYGQCFIFCALESDCPEGSVCLDYICVAKEIACDYIDCPDGNLCVIGECYPYTAINDNYLSLSGGLFDEASGGLKTLANTPISGATIYLFNETQTEINAFIVTDENGLFSFENLRPGIYTVFIDYPSYKVKGDGLITLKSDIKSTNLDIVLVNGEYELQLEYVTGLMEQHMNNRSINLFPNPSYGEIMLSSSVDIGEVDIRILDVTGRLITQKTMQIHKSKEINIADLKNEPSGLKIVLLYQDGQIIHKSTLIHKSK